MSFKKARHYFKFCPVCSGKLVIKKYDHINRLVCSQCDFVFYQNSKPTASALIMNKQSEILLVKRAIDPQKGYWDIPGGFLEDGEDLIVCLKREMKEELGITLKDIRYFGIYMDTYNECYSINTLNIVYQVKIARGKLKPDDDINDAKWFKAKDIPWLKLAFVWIKPALKDWQKYLAK